MVIKGYKNAQATLLDALDFLCLISASWGSRFVARAKTLYMSGKRLTLFYGLITASYSWWEHTATFLQLNNLTFDHGELQLHSTHYTRSHHKVETQPTGRKRWTRMKIDSEGHPI